MEQTKIEKPWGYEVIWAKTDQYVGKILHINSGQKLSLQYHEKKIETVYVKEGTLEVVLKVNDDLYTQVLLCGQSFHVPTGTVHRFCCPKDCNFVEIVEVSTPELDDVIRLQDDFGRL